MRRVERWARQTRLSEMLDFFRSLPEHIWITRPLLLGVNNGKEIRIHRTAPSPLVSAAPG
jgi:hypothetical protein